VNIFTETGVGKVNENSRYANVNQILYDFNGDAERCKGTECHNVEYSILRFHNGVAGRLVKSDKEAKWLEADKITDVQVMRIADFINRVVAKRRMPKHSDGELPPSVVMKLDVEGKEVDIVPDLVMSGALAHIDSLMVDWTDDLKDGMQWRPQVELVRKLRKSIEALVQVGLSIGLQHVTEVVSLDDETYSEFDEKLPQCQ